MCPQITLQNRVVLQKVKLSLYVQPPLVSTCDQFTFDFAGGLLCVLVFSAARANSAVRLIHGCLSFLNSSTEIFLGSTWWQCFPVISLHVSCMDVWWVIFQLWISKYIFLLAVSVTVFEYYNLDDFLPVSLWVCACVRARVCVCVCVYVLLETEASCLQGKNSISWAMSSALDVISLMVFP